MKVLIVGSGGREHALAWKLSLPGERVDAVFVAPGNAGTEETAENVPIDAGDVERLAEFASRKRIDLTIVGPEAPLVKGLADVFRERGLEVFGPSREAARLEASKVFAKEFMERHDIPTAAHSVFDDPASAYVHLSESAYPVVIKAEGLAAGKGVVVAESLEEGRRAIQTLMVDRVFGDSGNRVVIEECLRGVEVSVLAFSDGENHMTLFPSQDHKRAFDGDRGPNTGGMGAYAPLDFVGPETLERIEREILTPAVTGMAAEGRPYQGVLYAGLMLTDDGPRVLEFNCRFGDPETQVVLPLLEESLSRFLSPGSDGFGYEKVSLFEPREYAAGVVLASHGYPGFYEKGLPIEGIEAAREAGCLVFHAGTRREEGKIVTAGGRVLCVVGRGGTLERALEQAYVGCEAIDFEGKFHRKDIGRYGLDRGPAGA
jgi:phosphoribosylamine--glycine ligase